MQTKISLIVETHTKDNIFIATENGEIPSRIFDKCPKEIASDILFDITSYRIDPYEKAWLILELTDILYEKDTETAYIVFVCRVPGFPDKIEINNPYQWADYASIRDKLERLKGLI